MAADSVAAPFVRPEVLRADAVKRDLAHYEVSTDDAIRLVEEALVAYQCTIALNDALVVRHGAIRVSEQAA